MNIVKVAAVQYDRIIEDLLPVAQREDGVWIPIAGKFDLGHEAVRKVLALNGVDAYTADLEELVKTYGWVVALAAHGLEDEVVAVREIEVVHHTATADEVS